MSRKSNSEKLSKNNLGPYSKHLLKMDANGPKPYLRALIWGSPGTGKTPLALSVADHLKGEVLLISTGNGHTHYQKENLTIFPTRSPVQVAGIFKELAKGEHSFEVVIVDDIGDILEERFNLISQIDPDSSHCLRDNATYQQARVAHHAQITLSSFSLPCHFIAVAGEREYTSGDQTIREPNQTKQDLNKYDLQINTFRSDGLPVAMIISDRSNTREQFTTVEIFGEGLKDWVQGEFYSPGIGPSVNPAEILREIKEARTLFGLREGLKKASHAFQHMTIQVQDLIKSQAGKKKAKLLACWTSRITEVINSHGFRDHFAACLADRLPAISRDAKIQMPAGGLGKLMPLQLGALVESSLGFVEDPMEILGYQPPAVKAQAQPDRQAVPANA